MISFIEDVFAAEDAEFLALHEGVVFGLSEASGEDDGVVDQGVAFAGEEIGFGEIGEEGFWGEEGREEEVGGEVGAVVGADVEDDHGAHHLRG